MLSISNIVGLLGIAIEVHVVDRHKKNIEIHLFSLDNIEYA